MQEYKDKYELIDEIEKRGNLFINEFNSINELEKDKLIEGVDRTPSEIIAYQLGWMNLILKWEELEKEGVEVKTPTNNYKWNNLGGLYKEFYLEYENYSLNELTKEFNKIVDKIIELIMNYSDEELFKQNQRQWASTTKSNWPIWKWIHINTVAPFKTFRTKIRKWKKLNLNNYI